ncbi:AMIN domain-containing protein [Maridesulfovibrio sp.]|uniref:AMIN domain-containing protein n=1 Tax=Maridesulfovibrio sp. TaxID=2795000 RepID=UPI002A188BE0|nr:AMIN domain-containing protein [Maridesulfovibrio sp.]
MAEKSRNIIQCPFCDSNRLYFRRGLVADILISLVTPVRSYTCGSCSRSFRKYGNYFTSKQALIHIFGLLAIIAFINPSLLLPEHWLLKEQVPVEHKVETAPTSEESTDPLPLLSMAIANATNSSIVVENGTISVVENDHGNSTGQLADNSTESNGTEGNATAKTIMAFNGTGLTNSTTPLPGTAKQTDQPKQDLGLQGGKLRSIYFKAVDGKTRIELDLGGSPLSYTSFFLRNPDRLVVDIHGNWEYYGPTTLRPENPIFSRFRIGIYDDKIRMVMDLKSQTPAPKIIKTATGLDIDVK